MSRPKRTKAQREQDLVETARLLRRGVSKTEIARRLGVTRQQIVYDWRKLVEQLHEDREQDVTAGVAKKLAEYAEVKAEAWLGWERSKEDKRRQVAEKITTADGGSAASSTSRTKALKQTEGRLPDHDYLAIVLRCLEAERELEGLDPPKEHRLSGPDGGPIPLEVTEIVARNRAEAQAILSGLRETG